MHLFVLVARKKDLCCAIYKTSGTYYIVINDYALYASCHFNIEKRKHYVVCGEFNHFSEPKQPEVTPSGQRSRVSTQMPSSRMRCGHLLRSVVHRTKTIRCSYFLPSECHLIMAGNLGLERHR